jgi:RNA polymerase sigma factor (sigma-70 family)
MAEVTDMNLVRAYDRQGSEAAFAALVQRHISLVYSTAFRHVGIAAHAEEITQVVFVILARQAGRLRPDTILEGWLHETTRLTALRFQRGERRRQFREQEVYMQSTQPQAAGADTWHQLAPLLDEALARLGKKDRDALMLRYFKDQSLREVAAALRVNEEAAQKRVRRAVEKLRQFFHRRGVVHPAADLTSAISAHAVQAAPAALAQTVTAVAFAKGATAAGSTLTLINGVLKLMAWTKMKTAVAVLLAIGTTTSVITIWHAHRLAAQPDIQGAWEGVALIGGPGVQTGDAEHTRVVLKLYKTNGVYRATADAIDLGIKDVQITRIVYDFPTLRFDLEHLTSFIGTLNANATKMTFPGSPPAVFERTTTPNAAPERLTAEDCAPRAGSDLQGCWQGVFDGKVVVYWKIAAGGDGTFRGELDNPVIGENHKPFTVSYHRPTVTLTVQYGTGIFQGDLNAAGTEITGTWLQQGKYSPVTLKRTDYQPEPAPAESEYAFRSKTDLQGHWQTSVAPRLAQAWVTVGQMGTFPMNLDIARRPDGTFAAALTLPLAACAGWGEHIPPSDFQHPLPDVRLEWKALSAVFDARLVNGKLTGKFRVGDISAPLTFERRP